MANKRMFTMKIVDSDAFLEMPLSTQCLYFHLNMRADDDGFIGNPKKVMRSIGGVSDDDLKLLIAKRFLLTFDDGVIVIKHWRMHNTLSKNRYHETQYLDEKSLLRLKENGSYTFADGKEIDDSKYTRNEIEQKYDEESGKIEDADENRRTNGEQVENKRRTSGEQMATADSDLDLDSDIDLGLDKDSDKEKELKKRKYKRKEVYFPDEKLNDTFLDYIEMRKKIRSPMTERAITIFLNKLKKLADRNGHFDNDLAIEIIEQSIVNDWKSIYPLTDKQKRGNSQRDLMQELYDA